MSKPADTRIGLALGAGGANGLAHILMLEAFDELGLKPCRIAGSSIGAIIGTLYASGMSASDILEIFDRLVVRKNESWKEALRHKDIFEWIDFVEPTLAKGGMISGSAFLSFLYNKMQRTQFEQLDLPLAIVATDFWHRRQVIFDRGELLPAIQGSMAIPGLFTPVRFKGHLLVDGGMTNPVPYDILLDDCDLVVAIDVIGKKSPKPEVSFLDTIFNSFQIMQQTILAEKMQQHKPHIYIRPQVIDVRALEFYKLDDILEQARPAKEELKQALQKALA